jgi:hypothetical protein
MADTQLINLEASIKALPGVLGCVILATQGGEASEIQAFARVGADHVSLEEQIHGVVGAAGIDQGGHVRVHVFELDAESYFGDRQSLERAAELAEQEARTRGPMSPEGITEASDRALIGDLDHRPVVQRVVLTSGRSSEAEVSLGGASQRDVVGLATGAKTLHGLKVVAEATLDACSQLVQDFDVELRGASLITVAGQEAAVVLVRTVGDHDLVGSALLRNGPASEATVRATLDAVNRILLKRS